MMDKANRLSWLAGKKIRLSLLATQFTQYVYIRGGFSNDIERNFACKLLEMIQAVDIEGAKAVNDITKDAFRELVKSLVRLQGK